MSQHFLMSAAARSLSIGKVMRMSDQGAENVFARLRWPTTDGKPVCPDCGCTTCYDCRRGAYPRWRCKACGCDFSVTSGTLFAWRKLPLKTYLLSIVVFCNEVKGKSMLALSRDLGVQYKTAFVLAHKLREAMASALRGLTIGGEGKVAEIDGAYFGGHVRPENLAADRIDRRLAENQSGKRKVVVVMRERDGRTLPQVFASEDAAVSFIRARIAKGTVVHADESPAWNSLHAKFSMKRVNHQEGYSIDDACTNGAEFVLFADATRGAGASSSYRGSLFRQICPGSGLARRSSWYQQRRSGPWRYRISDGPWAISRFLRLLAAGGSRLDHPPSHAPRRLDAFDRIGRPVQRAEHGFLNQFACACIVFRQFLCRHHAFDDLARRHRSRCITQDVMDAPTTFAWTKPVVAPARWCRLECFGLDVRIKQPHGRFEMRQIGAMLIHLTLKTFDRVRDFQSLVAQGRDNQRPLMAVPVLE